MDRLGLGVEGEAAPVEQVAPRVDQEGRGGHLGRGARLAVTIEPEEATLPDDQTRGAQGGRQELAEPERGRVEPAGEFGHERDAARPDDPVETREVLPLARERQGAVDRLAVATGDLDRVEAEPLGGEQVDDVDVVAADQRLQAFHGPAAELRGLDSRPSGATWS